MSAVGTFPQREALCGTADMAGNVWEWTVSLWGKDSKKPSYGYPYYPNDERENLSASGEIGRVVRGGSFVNFWDLVRCAARYGCNPDIRSGNVGFRIVRAPGL